MCLKQNISTKKKFENRKVKIAALKKHSWTEKKTKKSFHISLTGFKTNPNELLNRKRKLM